MKGESMHRYIVEVVPLGIEFDVRAGSERDAYGQVWRQLSPDQQNGMVRMEVVDVVC